MRVFILGNSGGDSQIHLLSWLYEKVDVEEITFVKNKAHFMKLAKREPPEVVFIRLSGTQPTGLSILDVIHTSMENTEVIVISDASYHALEAYKAGASGYLIEPIERSRFESCFSKLPESKRQSKYGSLKTN